MSMLGRVGVWTWVDMLPAPQAAAFARDVEGWGYSALWLPEAVGRDPFVTIAFLGAHTQRLVFATGIANLYARDAMTMKALAQTTGEVTGGRFALGIGVSHSHLVTNVRGHEYGKPVTTMRAYLDATPTPTGPVGLATTPMLLTRSKLGIGRYSGVRPRTIWICPWGSNLTMVPDPSSTVQTLSCGSTRTVCAKTNP